MPHSEGRLVGISTSAKSDGASSVAVDQTTADDGREAARGDVKASVEATSAKRTVTVAETIFIVAVVVVLVCVYHFFLICTDSRFPRLDL